jgi:opacity protein-like surface antigen
MITKSTIRLIAAGAAAVVAIPSAAFAQETRQGPYVGVSAGLVLPEDSANAGQFDTAVPATPDFPTIAADTPLGWDTEFDNGFAIGGQVGYRFDNGFRLELDGTFNRYGVARHTGLTVGDANIDDVDVAVLTRGAPSAANPTVGEVLAQDDGEVTNYGLFGNVFYDINTGGGFSPYVGAGIGFQWVDVEYRPSDVDVADDTDSGLAYQLMAGASFDVSERAQLFGQYTYRSLTDDAEVPVNLLPATLGVESSQSIISAGLRVTFGG